MAGGGNGPKGVGANREKIDGGTSALISMPISQATDIKVYSSPLIPSGTSIPSLTSKIKSVKFWIKAFIPRTVPGLTEPLLGGPDKGQTVLKYVGFFHTDQRDFSDDVGASARIHLEFEVDLVAKSFTSIRWCACGLTKKYDDPSTGKVKESATATPTWTINMLRSSPLIVVEFSAAAGNPCAFSAPDIDFKGTVSINPATGDLELDCKIDDFPYYEAYATTNGGAGFKVFNASPLSGKTPADLFGEAKRVIKIQVIDADHDGIYDKQTILPGTIPPVS